MDDNTRIQFAENNLTYKLSDGANQVVTRKEIEQIRTLKDFDMTMLISEIHEHGWKNGGKKLLPLIMKATKEGRNNES